MPPAWPNALVNTPLTIDRLSEGAPLARLEDQIALNIPLDQFDHLRTGPDRLAEFMPMATMTSLRRLLLICPEGPQPPGHSPTARAAGARGRPEGAAGDARVGPL